MNKMNKKGFTLIEMLVVIAIIAILVSIIVPVVSNSTSKAAAATNAANLRTVAAQVAIAHMENPDVVKGTVTAASGELTFTSGSGATEKTIKIKAPVSKAVTVDSSEFCAKGEQMKIVIDTNGVTATYATCQKGIDDFADVADNGKSDKSN